MADAYEVRSLREVAQIVIHRIVPLQSGDLDAAAAVLEQLVRDPLTMQIIASNRPPRPETLDGIALVVEPLEPSVPAATLTALVVADVIRSVREALRR